MATPEAKVKAKLKKALDALHPHVHYYMPVSTGYGKHGIPDFLLCVRGHYWAIETKANGGKPTPLQMKQMTEIKNAGGQVFVIDETNIEEFIAWMTKLVAC